MLTISTMMKLNSIPMHTYSDCFLGLASFHIVHLLHDKFEYFGSNNKGSITIKPLYLLNIFKPVTYNNK